MKPKIKLIKRLERDINMSRLKALSEHSLEHPLDYKQYKLMMKYKRIVFNE